MINNIPNIIFITIVGAFVAAAAAYIGSLMVLKRMSLVGDALTHVALPGMAIALAGGISPTLGAFAALTIAIIGIWYLEETTENYSDAIVGIFFTGSLALGVLLTEDAELLEALFGSLEKLTMLEGLISILFSMLVIVGTALIAKRVIISVISTELAKSAGINTKLINLAYLLLIGLIVSLGIRFVGTLLMGALVIIPAVSARNITGNTRGYMFLSLFIGVISAITGILISSLSSLPVGAVVVCCGIVFFLITYLVKQVVKN